MPYLSEVLLLVVKQHGWPTGAHALVYADHCTVGSASCGTTVAWQSARQLPSNKLRQIATGNLSLHFKTLLTDRCLSFCLSFLSICSYHAQSLSTYNSGEQQAPEEKMGHEQIRYTQKEGLFSFSAFYAAWRADRDFSAPSKLICLPDSYPILPFTIIIIYFLQVMSAKAVIDNKPPQTYMHLHLKLKKLQVLYAWRLFLTIT